MSRPSKSARQPGLSQGGGEIIRARRNRVGNRHVLVEPPGCPCSLLWRPICLLWTRACQTFQQPHRQNLVRRTDDVNTGPDTRFRGARDVSPQGRKRSRKTIAGESTTSCEENNFMAMQLGRTRGGPFQLRLRFCHRFATFGRSISRYMAESGRKISPVRPGTRFAPHLSFLQGSVSTPVG